jgi:hypothetical protein
MVEEVVGVSLCRLPLVSRQADIIEGWPVERPVSIVWQHHPTDNFQVKSNLFLELYHFQSNQSANHVERRPLSTGGRRASKNGQGSFKNV